MRRTRRRSAGLAGLAVAALLTCQGHAARAGEGGRQDLPAEPGREQVANLDALRSRLTLTTRVDGTTGVRISEGTFAVFENRVAASGRVIHLPVVILHARSATPKPDPLFVFAGGPGADATQSARAYLSSWMLADRDIVFAAQRGTAGDNRLACPRAVDDGNVQGYLDPLFRTDVFRPCLADLQKRFDLTKYSTPLAADDYDELRRALGYGSINVTGGSYGTRMALVYMRQYGASVRSATLSGVAPIAFKNPLYHAAGLDLAIRGLIAECASDRACRQAVPKLDEEFRAILTRLDKSPATTAVAHPVTGEKVAVRLSREGFLEALRVMMYSAARNRRVPFLLHRAFEGHFESFAEVGLASERSLRQSLALGHLLSVTCAEDVARIREDEIVKIAEPTLAGDGRVRSQKRICALWPSSDIAPGYGEPVRVAVPTLLLSGTLDPVTPSLWGDEAAGHLPQSVHVVVPGAHGVGGACITDIRRRFLAAGSVVGLDVSCAKAQTPAPFVLR
jgi:pimeloyl-ACP methyl ester carboxylesterase